MYTVPQLVSRDRFFANELANISRTEEDENCFQARLEVATISPVIHASPEETWEQQIDNAVSRWENKPGVHPGNFRRRLRREVGLDREGGA